MTILGILFGISMAMTLLLIVFYAFALFAGLENEYEKGIGKLLPWVMITDVILGIIVLIYELIQ